MIREYNRTELQEMLRSWLVAGSSCIGMGFLVGIGIWSMIRPQFPDTLWLGTGCVEFSMVSSMKATEGWSAMEPQFERLLSNNAITLESLSLSASNTSLIATIEGFMHAKTATAARKIFKSGMSGIRDSVDSYNDIGIYEATDCGFKVQLPVNQQDTISNLSNTASNQTRGVADNADLEVSTEENKQQDL